MKFDLENKRVLVTGASRGIGKAIAQMMAANGARVAVHYVHNQPAANETVASLPSGPHMMVQGDVTEPQAVKHLLDSVIEQFGGIDVVVNNAGIYERISMTDVDYGQWRENWQRTIETNLTGPANLAYLAAHTMRKSGGGKIINITSRGAFRGEPEAPAYGAAKAGLNSLSQSLAKKLAPDHVFVYAVAPGYVETEMVTAELAGRKGLAIRAQSPLNRVAQPAEIAQTVCFLASPGNDFLTGSIIDINGASYLRT